MNEKNLKVLEQYDLEIRTIRRGRDSYVLDTNQGIALLKEYNGSVLRAAWIEKVCRTVNESGIRSDIPIANREGNYVSTDRDEKRYMLKLWTSAREIDVKNNYEIYEAVDNLARLHKVLNGFVEDKREMQQQEPTFEKRMRELRKIFRYVKEKKRKNPFEINFMQEYNRFMEMCEEAQCLSQRDNIQRLRAQAMERGCVCHGDYNQHNVLKEGSKIVTVNFEHCAVGVQTDDLYCFMRKMLEKHNWKLELAQGMLETYINQGSLTKDALEELYIQFLFPEKFWKISNHYYNSKKTWIPDRSLQKLDKMIQQFQSRRLFLEYFKNTYIT